MKAILSNRKPKGCENIYWIDTEQGLAEAVAHLLSNGQPHVLYLDTEFERTKTYYAMGALLQLSDGLNIYLIDLSLLSHPHQIPKQLKSLLTDQKCLKVFHSGREDLELIDHLWSVWITPIFDTQWAADFIMNSTQMGLAALLNAVCGFSLDKSVTRSDWLRRPLSDEQLEYAALDVWFLAPLFNELFDRLVQRCIWDEVIEDCQWIYHNDHVSPIHKVRWTPDAWYLSPVQLQRLVSLYAWRQDFLHRKNIPKAWSLSDVSLYRLACLSTIEKAQLRNALGSDQRFLSKYWNSESSSIVEMLEAPEMYWASVKGDTQWGQVPPLSPSVRPLLKQLKSSVVKVASGLNWRSEQLSRKKWVNQWLRIFLYCQLNDLTFEKALLPAVWQSWRGDLLLPEFNRVMIKEIEGVAHSVKGLRASRGVNLKR